MGLFSFFKRSSSESKQEELSQCGPTDYNVYLLEVLTKRLVALGYTVDWHTQYQGVMVNSEIEIATAIVNNPDTHLSLLTLRVLTVHAKYFPQGIMECMMGVGTTWEARVDSVLNNYIDTTFLTIRDGFSEGHNPALDFSSTVNDKQVLWHPKLGALAFQGQWSEQPQGEPLFEIVREKLKGKMTANKFNWLKIYISKQKDNIIIGECNFNNEPWEEGMAEITKYAESWKMDSPFQGLKQFMVFRRCDACDE